MEISKGARVWVIAAFAAALGVTFVRAGSVTPPPGPIMNTMPSLAELGAAIDDLSEDMLILKTSPRPVVWDVVTVRGLSVTTQEALDGEWSRVVVPEDGYVHSIRVQGSHSPWLLAMNIEDGAGRDFGITTNPNQMLHADDIALNAARFENGLRLRWKTDFWVEEFFPPLPGNNNITVTVFYRR